MPEADLERVFGRFERLDGEPYPGTGLGLAVLSPARRARRRTDLDDAERPAPRRDRAPHPAGIVVTSLLSTDQVTVLIVDDTPQNLTAIGAVLEPLGYRLLTASSGEEALRHLLDRGRRR